MSCPDHAAVPVRGPGIVRYGIPVLLCLALGVVSPGSIAQDNGDSATDDETTLSRARELLQRGSYETAIDVFSNVQDPFYREETLLGRSRALAAVGRYQEAIDLLESEIDDHADQPGLSTRLAELLRDTGRSAEALNVLEAVVQGLNNPPVRALVRYGELLDFRGDREQAVEMYNRAIQRYDSGQVFESGDIAMIALAYRELDRFHDANALFSEAVDVDGNNLEAQVMWGDLFQFKFNNADAEESYSAALDVNRRYTPALVGMARIEGSQQNLERVLSINPDQVEALEVFADLLVRNQRFDEAQRFLDRALEVNPESVPALATRAALAVLHERQDEYEDIRERLEDFSPDNPGFYTRIADLHGHLYRFEEAVAFARRAIEADPEHWQAHTVLGNNLVRLGQEEEGREHLELAFDNDPFNVRSSNLLQVFDTIEGYATLESEHFRVRMSERDARVLWPYMEPLLERSWDRLVDKYGFEPETPVLIQLFENREDFAVRSAGLPDIGPLVGICFGKVITLISPDELTANWQEIAWHELVHVFTLQMTDNRIPRWFSEGISTWEEGQARDHWGRRQGLQLARAVKEDRLLPVSRLNDGFSGARSNEDLGFAYFQSYMVVDYIAEQYGFDTLLELIEAYGEVMDRDERFRQVFGIDMETFDGEFRQWVDERVQAMDVYVHEEDAPDEGAGHGHGLQENPSDVLAELYNNESLKRYMRNRIEQEPRDFQAHLQLGIVLFKEERFEDALTHLQTAYEILPQYTGYPSPPLVMSQIHEQRGDREAMLAQLERLLEHQQNDYSSAMTLAEDALEKGDLERAQRYAERALAVNPYQMDVHRASARIADATGQTGRAVDEYRILAELENNDPVRARTDLARAYLEDRQPEQARMSVLRALETAPTYEEAQQVLLEAVDSQPQEGAQ